MVDSILIQCALAGLWRYFTNYRLLSWNIPAVENFTKKLSWRLVTYLGKCIPIDRKGSAEHTGKVLDKLRYLVQRGEVVTLFPEGTRSRTGRVSLTEPGYGVGKIVQAIPQCDVLCIYMRGASQNLHSNFPAVGDKIYLEMDLITPTSSATGYRAVRESSLQILSKIKQMEDSYFLCRA